MTLDPRRTMAFSVFAEHLNFTRAALALHVTQPALHMQVKQLEEEAGTTLYQRVGQRLDLTEAGTRIAALGRRIREQILDVERDLGGATSTSPTRLCTGEGALLHLLPRGIRAFLALKLGPLRILTLERAAALKAITDGTAHLAVTSVETVPTAPLRWLKLCDVPQVLAVPRGHRLARSRFVKMDALVDTPLIVPPAGSPLRTAIDAQLPGANVAVETHGWPVMLTCVAWGMGVAVVNGFCVPPRNVVLRPIKGLPPRRYGCVWHASQEGNARVTALRNALVRGLSP